MTVQDFMTSEHSLIASRGVELHKMPQVVSYNIDIFLAAPKGFYQLPKAASALFRLVMSCAVPSMPIICPPGSARAPWR
jgi:hypothetical protein